MTIAQSLKLATAKLSAKKINNPPLEAEILLSAILRKPREFLLTHPEHKLTAGQTAKFKFQISRRLKGEPVAYLIGQKEFYGLNFMVNKNVLIPRPETELMVEEAMKLATHNPARPAGGSQLVTFVDVGTGSGCIIITLAKLLSKESRIMNHELWGIDISKKALAVAKQNARAHSVSRIKFVPGNLLEPILNSKFQIPDSNLVILANLPYGWRAWKNNCSLDTVGLKFEPEIALFTGKNGLELYEKLFKQINRLISSRKFASDSSIFALCEFDPRQTKMMEKLIRRELPKAKCEIKKDLSGLDRLAIINISTGR